MKIKIHIHGNPEQTALAASEIRWAIKFYDNEIEVVDEQGRQIPDYGHPNESAFSKVVIHQHKEEE